MPASGALSSPGKGLRFLSFDGGGIKSVSQALMVREMMNRVGVDHQLSSPAKVCDYFDMICGSGFGGLLAIMCGILKMTGDELVDEFLKLCEAVFSEGLDTTQRTIVLEGEIKRLIGTYSGGGEEQKIMGTDDICKVFVCAAPYHNTSHPRIFRNYQCRANASVDCMLWEAGRATTATPDLFNPIVISKESIGEKFVGGDLKWNNPTEELTKEAADIFKDCYVTSIINIGSGHPGYMSLSKGLTDLLPRIVIDCEGVADDMERRFGGTPEAFWRLSVEQGLQHTVVDLSNLDALVSHTRSYLQGARTTRSIDVLSQDLIRRPQRIPVNSISGVAPVEFVLYRKHCPPPTQYFTGRRADLEKLDEHFTSGRGPCRIAVLYGIGGGGKSQTGFEFIQRSHGRFTDVFFIDASDKFTLENDLKAIVIGVSDKPTINDALNFLRTTKAEWLLFLDNADDPSLDLRPYIMWSHGNVLITTRNPEVRMHAPDCSIWVDKLELDDAKELLLTGVATNKSSEAYEIASEIVQKLGCLALAVNQARGFLAQDICTLGEYLPMYMQNRRQLLEDRLIQSTDGYEHTVYTTWTISFNKLSSAAAFFVELLCFMHYDAIPAHIFEDAWKVYDGWSEGVVPTRLITFLSAFNTADSTWSILNFRLLIKEILSFSLIEFNAAHRTISLHPLVQEWARGQCRHARETVCSTQTLLSLAASMTNGKEEYAVQMSLLPHLRASAQTGLKVHFTLLRYLGRIYYRGGMVRECSEVHEQEVSKMQQQFGSEHPDTLTSMGDLANAYYALGQLSNALELQEKVLALRTQIQGEEHPATLICMNNLAGIYSALGQFKSALKLDEKVLALKTQVMGVEHPSTVTSMASLASTHLALNQHKDALTLQEKALALMTHIRGERHPDTLTGMNNLAAIYSDLGQREDAMKLHGKVLSLRTQTLGEEHPATLMSMSNLALTYTDLGKDRDALKLQEKALALRTQILGEEHPETLTSMSHLARIYSDLGQHQDALKHWKEVLELSTNIHGEKHPTTLIRLSGLADTYSALGEHKDALILQEKVLALEIQTHGQDHPSTLTQMNNLALVYLNLGQHEDALKLQGKVLSLRTQTLGEEHPATLTSMGNLAQTYSYLGQNNDALKLQEKVVALWAKIQGDGHRGTFTSWNNLAQTYSRLGQHKDALKHQEQALALATQIFGEEHPNTIACLSNLASIYTTLGQHRDALKLEEKVLAFKVQILGEEHPETLTCMGDIAITYFCLHRYQDALELHKQTLNMRRRVIGPEHPDTIGSLEWVDGLADVISCEREGEDDVNFTSPSIS